MVADIPVVSFSIDPELPDNLSTLPRPTICVGGSITPFTGVELSPDVVIQSISMVSKTPHKMRFVFHEDTGRLEIVVEDGK